MVSNHFSEWQKAREKPTWKGLQALKPSSSSPKLVDAKPKPTGRSIRVRTKSTTWSDKTLEKIQNSKIMISARLRWCPTSIGPHLVGKSAQSEDLVTLWQLVCHSYGEIAVFKTGKSFHTISELHCILITPEGIHHHVISHEIFIYTNGILFFTWTSQLSYIFKLHFTILFGFTLFPSTIPTWSQMLSGFASTPAPNGAISMPGTAAHKVLTPSWMAFATNS